MGSLADDSLDTPPDLPIAISFIGGRYLLFDVQAVSYLRRKYQLCGAMIGTLPQSPSQNMFLGLPVEIMAEEAQLFMEKGVGYILDDARAHDQAIRNRNGSQRADYMRRLHQQARDVKGIRDQEQAEKKRKAIKKRSSAPNTPKPGDPAPAASLLDFDEDTTDTAGAVVNPVHTPGSDAVNELPATATSESTLANTYRVTLTTSDQLLSTSDTPDNNSPDLSSQTPESLLNLPSSYPLYRHLNSKGYFMTPGLRFGCQYTVYPGDPLRFHSHFLAQARSWDEPINLMDIVSGGRLGTGVKKSFLVGGENPDEAEKEGSGVGEVRTWSIEWAAM